MQLRDRDGAVDLDLRAGVAVGLLARTVEKAAHRGDTQPERVAAGEKRGQRDAVRVGRAVREVDPRDQLLQTREQRVQLGQQRRRRLGRLVALLHLGVVVQTALQLGQAALDVRALGQCGCELHIGIPPWRPRISRTQTYAFRRFFHCVRPAPALFRLVPARERAAVLVVVYDADGLEIGVDDGGACELHPAAAQVGRHLVRQRRGRAGDAVAVPDGFPLGEVPDIGVEAAPLVLDGKEDTGIIHGGVELPAVADDGGVLHERVDLLCTVLRDSPGVKAVQRGAERLPLMQDAGPRESGLKRLQQEQLERIAVVMVRAAPLLVVVPDIERVGQVDPSAAFRGGHGRETPFGKVGRGTVTRCGGAVARCGGAVARPPVGRSLRRSRRPSGAEQRTAAPEACTGTRSLAGDGGVRRTPGGDFCAVGCFPEGETFGFGLTGAFFVGILLCFCVLLAR